MRITNQMMTNNVLLNINRNRSVLAGYEEQIATGKKIQKPSDDPIVAVRALRFRTNVKEISQYKANAEDAISWANVSEQAVSNVTDIMTRVRELSVSMSSDIMNLENRKNSLIEVGELMSQALNETNASYVGRHVFGGYKTNVPVVFKEASADNYELVEHFTTDSVESVQRVVNNGTMDEIIDVNRLRLGYDAITAGDTATLLTDLGGPFTAVNALNSDDPNAYTPALNEVNFLADTGELIFNEGNLTDVPATFDVTYTKNTFDKTDLVPEHYFEGANLTTGRSFVPNDEDMNYQISYSQELTVNIMAYDVVSVDMQRDLEEIIYQAQEIDGDGSLASELKEDLLGDMFNKMIGKMDKHMDNLLSTRSKLGGKINRLELTINRLDEDNINFTDLLSENEDINYAEIYIKMSSMESIYQASLNASSKILQPTLLDFIR